MFNEPPPRQHRLGIRQLHFTIDVAYRRQRFIEGADIPSDAKVSCHISELTENQRGIIVDSIADGDFVPATVQLPMPTICDTHGIDLAGSTWSARVDPPSNPKANTALLAAWESDYETKLSELRENS